MDWNVQLQKKIIVKLPSVLSTAEPMAVDIDGKTYEMRWDNTSQTIFIKTQNGETPVRLRSHSIKQFEGDQDSQVEFEWSARGKNPIACTATVSPYSFFSSDSTKKKSDKLKIVRAQMNGRLFKVDVKPGDTLKAGDLLCVIEAMKMENRILAPLAGTLEKVNIKAGDAITIGQELFRFK